MTVLLPFPAPTNGTTIDLHLGGTAEFGTDYLLFGPGGGSLTNSVVFNAGDLEKRISVRAVDDAEQATRSRAVSLALVSSTNYLIDPRQAKVTLVENDLPSVAVIATDLKAMEAPGTATNTAAFTIRRYGTNDSALTVHLNISGTASNGVDYSLLITNPVIPAGSNAIALYVTPLPDTNYEGSETVILTLLSNSGYSILTNGSTATVTIMDDDLAVVSFIATDPFATEYNNLKAATITLRRTGNPAEALAVPLAVGGTASNGIDYQILTNNVLWTGSNVVFVPGSSNLAITVKPLADSLEEQAETVVLTIKGSVAYKIGASNSVSTFIDDDHATRYQVVELKQATVYQPGSIDSPAVYELRRWGRSDAAVNVPFQMWTNAGGGPIRTFYYRAYGDISGENFVFASYATRARLNATAQTGGSLGTGLDGINLMVPSIDTTLYPMWFRPKWEYVRIEVVDTNAVEGTTTKGKLRFTRLFNGPPVYVNLTISGNAAPGTDHNLPQLVSFSIPTNVLVVETNITALADTPLEGWETVIITTEYLPIQTTYDLRSPYMVFLRDNVAITTGLPETDTDRDGLPDRWEVANGLDPFTPGEESLDPDKDGLTNVEEAALNMNPNAKDSDSDGEDDFMEASHSGASDKDYLEVRLFTQDTGKVNNGMNCAVCHTTNLRVGDYTHFSPKHGTGTEKKFFFKKGTNYPIYLSELIQNLPTDGPTTGTPTTTEKYTAGVVPAPDEPRAFVVNDPNAKLGTNKLWSNFPADPSVSIGTLVVPKIEVFWTNYPGNIPLDNNPNTGGGVRVFPDQISPTDNINRNRVQVRVKTTPPLAGQIVRLKSFDVDDPIAEGDVVKIDDNDLAGASIGKDNRGLPQEGALANLTLTLNAQGEATTDFFVTMQPGDNFRVAALLDTAGASTHLNQLQVTNESGAFYVGGNNEHVPAFVGGISPILTVWRKLHLEFDSMAAPPASGPEANFVSGTVFGVRQNYPAAGRTQVRIAHPIEAPPNNRFERGKLEIPGVGAYPVLKSLTFVGQVQFVTYLDVQALVPIVPNGTTAKMYDDDDQYLAHDPVYPSLVGLQSPPTPADGRSGEFIQGMAPAYAKAYIFLVDANAAGWNTVRTIPFKRNTDIGKFSSPFDAGNLQLKGSDRANFWAYSIVFGYEGNESEDGEPDTEEPLLGINADDLLTALVTKFCVVYLEANRDKVWGVNRNDVNVTPGLFANAQWAATYRDIYLGRLYATIAHELGHAPGTGIASKFDHLEEGLMQAGASSITTDSFTAKSIRRFRAATKWSP